MRNRVLYTTVLAAMLAACAEVPPADDVSTQFPGQTVASATQAVSLQTRFRLAGADDVETDFGLENLTIHVGSLLLDPSAFDGTAFATKDPFVLAFDVASGEVDISGPDILLPYVGDYFVSMQVEPSTTSQIATDHGSVVAEGFYGADDGTKGDEPSPLPWEPKTDTAQLHDFTYRSDAVARLQLGEVSLQEDGTYELLLTINVSDWLRERVIPSVRDQAQRAADDAEDAEAPDVEHVVVTGMTDPDGAGTRALIGDIAVGTRRF